MELTKNENVERRIYGKLKDVNVCVEHMEFEFVIRKAMDKINNCQEILTHDKPGALFRLYYEKYNGNRKLMMGRAKRDLKHVREQIIERAKHF